MCFRNVFSVYHSKTVLLLQFFLQASVFAYVAFLSLFVTHFFFRCLCKAVRRNCGISWVSSLIDKYLNVLDAHGTFLAIFTREKTFVTSCIYYYLDACNYSKFHIQSKLNDSNIFRTMEIFSRYG